MCGSYLLTWVDARVRFFDFNALLSSPQWSFKNNFIIDAYLRFICPVPPSVGFYFSRYQAAYQYFHISSQYPHSSRYWEVITTNFTYCPRTSTLHANGQKSSLFSHIVLVASHYWAVITTIFIHRPSTSTLHATGQQSQLLSHIVLAPPLFTLLGSLLLF